MLFGPSVSLFVSVFSAWSYFTLLVFVSSSSFKVVKMCIRSTDHVSRLLKRLEIEWGAEGVNFIRLYFTTVFYLERGLTSFYVRNFEPNFAVENNGICLTFEFLEFLFFRVSLLFTFFTIFFKICRQKLSVNKYQIDS